MSTRIRREIYAVMALVAVFGGAQQAPARERALRTPGLLNTSGFYRLEADGAIGLGTQRFDLGQVDGDDARISGGGGLGGAATFGFGFSREWDLDVTAGFQRSEMLPDPEGMDATFRRNFFLATLKYKIPVSAVSQFKFGLGGGIYEGGKLNVDVSDPLLGPARSVKYREAFGWHATGELETFLAPTLSVVIGAKYYSVEYEAKSARENGLSVSTATLPDGLRNFNGNGVDLTVGLAAYF